MLATLEAVRNFWSRIFRSMS